MRLALLINNLIETVSHLGGKPVKRKNWEVSELMPRHYGLTTIEWLLRHKWNLIETSIEKCN